MTLKDKVYAYIRQNTLLLTVLMIIFLTGVVFGSLGVIFLDAAQTKEISFFVDKVFNDTTATATANYFTIINASIKLFLVIWFLGLTIVGIPLIAAVVFTRGFALGFTGAFIMKIKGLSGVFAVILALFPPNILAIPLLLFAAANSIIFSLCLIKSSKKDMSLPKNFLAFTASMIFVAFISAGIGALQGFLSPLALKTVFYITGR